MAGEGAARCGEPCAPASSRLGSRSYRWRRIRRQRLRVRLAGAGRREKGMSGEAPSAVHGGALAR
jgi:hypothetical protein